MKVAKYGTTIVIIHVITHALHGLAHAKIPIPLSLSQGLFIGIVIMLMPVIAAALLWTRLSRTGLLLFLSSLFGATLFGLYNHFIVLSPDHVSQVAFTGWGLLFQLTAVLTLIIDGWGCWISMRALKTMPQAASASNLR